MKNVRISFRVDNFIHWHTRKFIYLFTPNRAGQRDNGSQRIDNFEDEQYLLLSYYSFMIIALLSLMVIAPSALVLASTPLGISNFLLLAIPFFYAIEGRKIKRRTKSLKTYGKVKKFTLGEFILSFALSFLVSTIIIYSFLLLVVW